jgi:hypothetical protein
MSSRSTLTPALSHPMGEGEVVPAFGKSDGFELAWDRRRFSLSHRMGEGRGEGLRCEQERGKLKSMIALDTLEQTN